MGSDSDLPVLSPGLEILREFGVPYELRITSAHRTPRHVMEVAAGAAARGVRVVIAAAGGAAALPGMFASGTALPVIGVPVKTTHLDGMDSLLSIVQMPVSAYVSVLRRCPSIGYRFWCACGFPVSVLSCIRVLFLDFIGHVGAITLADNGDVQKGIPTATVGINNSINAALLAIQILGSFLPEYQEQVVKYREDMERTVLEKDVNVKAEGHIKYLAR